MTEAAPMKDLYEVLGVARDAPESEIVTAYRKKVSKVHPDNVPGKVDEFHQLTTAYHTLTDLRSRAIYDKTGAPPLPPDKYRIEIFDRAMDSLAKALSAVDDEDLPYVNLLQIAAQVDQNMLSKQRQMLANGEATLVKWKKALPRLKTQRPDNVLQVRLMKNIRDGEAEIELAKYEIEKTQAVLTFLEEYEWEQDPVPEVEDQPQIYIVPGGFGFRMR